MAKATKTIFVGHKPGTFKAYYGLTSSGKTGWYVAFLDSDGNISHPDGEDVYAHRTGAYRRVKQLNDLLAENAAGIGTQAGVSHGIAFEARSRELMDARALTKEDPTGASHEYRIDLARQKARESGYISSVEINAYADGYEKAFLETVLHHKLS